MKKYFRHYTLTTIFVCTIVLISSCSKSIVGRYIGNPEFKKGYSAYSSLDLAKDKTFILKNEATSFDYNNESTSITETYGKYRMHKSKLVIEPQKYRTAEIVYILGPMKKYSESYKDSRVLMDTLNRSKPLIPIDTLYEPYQPFDIVKKTKFKKYKRENSIYFVSEGVIFSGNITGRPLDEKNKCPALNESSKAPANSY